MSIEQLNLSNMEAYAERANKSVPDLIKTNSNYVECWRNGYIRGASEQATITKQEMIDKAFEWFCDNLVDFVEYNEVEGFNVNYGQFEKDFRKAMEK